MIIIFHSHSLYLKIFISYQKDIIFNYRLNINFIKAPDPGTQVRAVGRVIHNGRKTLVVECDVYGHANVLVGKARGTFYVVGEFDRAFMDEIDCKKEE